MRWRRRFNYQVQQLPKRITNVTKRVISWTGFGGKTLWDWLKLLIIPIAVFLATQFFTERSAQIEREAAANNLHEAALNQYLDYMTQLLLHEGLNASNIGDPVRDVARVRTLTALRAQTPDRRRIIIQFLQDANLIGRDVASNILSFRSADLEEMDLRGIDLSYTDLAGANLRKADLGGAELQGANLSGATLNCADLQFADLFRADLSGANLLNANLKSAVLGYVNFSDADLRKADLRFSALEGATLQGAFLHGANLQNIGLSDVDLSNAIYNANTRWPQNFVIPDTVTMENGGDVSPCS
jgi:uncharacterized protein YjbI with pentapeptide repeats